MHCRRLCCKRNGRSACCLKAQSTRIGQESAEMMLPTTTNDPRMATHLPVTTHRRSACLQAVISLVPTATAPNIQEVSYDFVLEIVQLTALPTCSMSPSFVEVTASNPVTIGITTTQPTAGSVLQLMSSSLPTGSYLTTTSGATPLASQFVWTPTGALSWLLALSPVCSQARPQGDGFVTSMFVFCFTRSGPVRFDLSHPGHGSHHDDGGGHGADQLLYDGASGLPRDLHPRPDDRGLDAGTHDRGNAGPDHRRHAGPY